MRNRWILPVILCFLTVLSLCACADQSAADGAYTPVKDDSGNITGYERKYHNDNGDITRWDVYDAQEQYDHYILYEYDSDNRLAKETYYQADGIGVYYYAYTYSEEGVLSEKDYVNAKEGSERILYDSEGKEDKRYSYDTSDQMIRYEEYQDGAWVEKELPTEATEAEDIAE